MDTEQIPSSSGAGDCQSPCLEFRKQVLAILVLLILISGTFNIYLWRQYRQRRAELDSLRQQMAPMVAEYNQVAPRMDEFVKRILEYGKSHPDFGPIMVKYGLTNNSVPAMAVPPGKK